MWNKGKSQVQLTAHLSRKGTKNKGTFLSNLDFKEKEEDKISV